MKRGKRGMDKKGQFYLIATIIIVGVVIALSVTLNYSSKKTSTDAQEMAKELSIESEKVLDYETNTGARIFEDFSEKYSSYAGDDKSIYFIVVDENNGIKKAYKYVNHQKVDLTSDLDVSDVIRFRLDNKDYIFKLEEGKNFYSIVVYDTGGDRYVYTG